MTDSQRVDLPTIAGLALLLMPLLTMLHEIGGHAFACMALGGDLREIGAFYVDCAAPTDMAGRLVNLAGPGVDAVAAVLAFAVSQRLSSDRARLIGWYVWLGCAFSASGYFLYSGVTGIGDLGVDGTGGFGPLPMPMLWRALFVIGGGLAYVFFVRRGMASLNAMIGTGRGTIPARRRIAHGFYVVLCLSAMLASLPNPIGLFITFASAAAASFGGKAGFIPIGFKPFPQDAPKLFVIERSVPLILAGIAMTLAFTLVLGPTVRFG